METPEDLLKTYHGLLKLARQKGYIQTDNFVGDIIETIVCDRIGTEKVRASKKGYDATNKNGSRIQIKFRTVNDNGIIKITFKNLDETRLNFDVIVVATMDGDSYLFFVIGREKMEKRVVFKNDIAIWKTQISELKEMSHDSWVI